MIQNGEADAPEGTPSDQRSFVPLKIGNFFSCEVPADWSTDSTTFGLSQEEKKVYGVVLRGPWSGDISVTMSLHYYEEGNLLYKSADHYLRLFSQPVLGVALTGSRYDPVSETKVHGRKAWVFERQKNEFVPLHNNLGSFDKSGKDPRVYERREMMAKPVPVRERFVVLPGDTDFYALRYTSPAEQFDEFLPLFERVTATFQTAR